MEKTLIIEGMSCGHCSSSVEAALKGLDGVESVEVILDENLARVKGQVAEDALKDAIESIGFDLVEIK